MTLKDSTLTVTLGCGAFVILTAAYLGLVVGAGIAVYHGLVWLMGGL